MTGTRAATRIHSYLRGDPPLTIYLRGTHSRTSGTPGYPPTVEIHDTLDTGAEGFGNRYMVPALKKIQFDRDQAPSSDAPTLTPAPTPALATAQSVEPPEAETDQQWQAKNAGAACHIARTAPSTPSAVGLAEGPDLLSLAELAGLTELSNDEAAAALAAACPRGPH